MSNPASCRTRTRRLPLAGAVALVLSVLAALVLSVAPSQAQEDDGDAEVPTAQFETPTPVPTPELPTPNANLTPSAGSIGVSPIELVLEDVLRGSPSGAALLVRNGTAKQRPFEFAFVDEGDGVAEWLRVTTFDDRDTTLDSVEVDALGEAQVRVEANVPDDVANGTYQAVLNVTAPALDDGTVGAGISVAVTLVVSGTQRLEGALLDVGGPGQGEVGVGVQLTASVENTGNVILAPVLSVRVLDADGELVDEFTTEGGDPVDPGETRALGAVWDTATADVGEYTIEVSASVEGIDLGSGSVTVELQPRGTLTRAGQILSIDLVEPPQVGALAQVRIRIQNSGSIEATGTFVGQVTLDGTVVQAIESPPRFIASGEEDSVDVFVEVPSEGEYRVAGTVNFEGFESDEAELVFTVGDAGGSDGSSLGLILGIVAGVVVVAGAAAFLLRRRRSA